MLNQTKIFKGKTMKCNTCFAVVESGKEIILSQGKWNAVKHYNRVCKYALERGKPCCNSVRITDDSLSWESLDNQTKQEFSRLYDRLIMES